MLKGISFFIFSVAAGYCTFRALSPKENVEYFAGLAVFYGLVAIHFAIQAGKEK
ncbi:MAG: hypothetical protein WC609_01445 [Candidatus Paceibacterota bacterium]|jgi:hypothetical protein